MYVHIHTRHSLILQRYAVQLMSLFIHVDILHEMIYCVCSIMYLLRCFFTIVVYKNVSEKTSPLFIQMGQSRCNLTFLVPPWERGQMASS